MIQHPPKVEDSNGAVSRLTAWLPLGLGIVYVLVLLVRYPALVRRVYWDSDAASFAVGGQTVGHAGVLVLGHFASYTTLAFLVLTRWLPLHRQVWEVSQYAFALASVALLTWASWRLAGRWAATMTATIGVAVSPIVNYARVALDYHLAPGVAAAVVATFVVWLALGARGRRVPAVAVLVAIVLGASSASDALFVVVGFVPFVAAGIVFLFVLRDRYAGVVVMASSMLALPAVWATVVLARTHVTVSPAAPLQIAPGVEVWPHAKRVLGSIVEVANGNFTETAGWTRATLTAGYVLSLICAVLMGLALSAPIVLLRRGLRARTHSPALVVWSTFWAVAVAANVAGAIFTQAGAQPEAVIYQLTALEAVAATVPLAMSTSRHLRSLAGIAIAIVAATGLINLLHWPRPFSPVPVLASLEARIEAIARTHDALHGYAGYWDASSLTWSSRMALAVEPVSVCQADALCPLPFNEVSTWYQPHNAGSFVLRNTDSTWLPNPPPASLGRPAAAIRLDRQYTMYVYDYDVASRFDDAQTVWAPTLSYGGGFAAAGTLGRASSQWITQAARLRITTGIAVRVSLSTIASSNRVPRTLELVGSGGRVLGKARVPARAVRLHFGPFLIPSGTSTLTLTATPGPQPLGPADLLAASVDVEALSMAATPAIVSNRPRAPR